MHAILQLARLPTHVLPFRRWVVFGTLSGGFWVALLAVWGVRKVLLAHYQYRMWRLVRTAVVLAFVAGLVRGDGWKGIVWGACGTVHAAPLCHPSGAGSLHDSAFTQIWECVAACAAGFPVG